MTSQDTLTTGQASKVFAIPIKSIQKYVKKFADYFSPEAKQSKCGRRFNKRDQVALLTIRRMSLERKTEAEIIQALQEPSSPLPPAFDMITTLNFVQAAQAEIKGNLAKVKTIQENLKWQEQAYSNLRTKFRRLTYEHEIMRMELLRLKLIFRRPETAPTSRKNANVWEQFRAWVWEGFENDLGNSPDPITLQYSRLRLARKEYLKDFRHFEDELDPGEIDS